jgi:DNA-binding GntR family transcriptional regulator
LPALTRYQNYYTEFLDTDTENPWSDKVIHQHAAIVSAIKMHMPDLARSLMNEHIRSGISQAAFSYDNPIPLR